ncbi:glutaminyl-peptide cyclotransferase [Flavobacterium sp.]|uniref:glutaminyl-peptide cyclotransferase n=1 Tax=Flavobacterium sp. TaxID=239 RepID=UPI00286AECAD|nr:glutaminyl-peptide cyclotransferase [Flavobacterium sp.]
MILIQGCKENHRSDKKTDKDIGFAILNTYSHDINSFTEGLFFYDNKIYESTGSPNDMPNAKSVIGILDLRSGLLNVKVELDKDFYFGEGIAKCKDKIYQLTYKNRKGFIYDFNTFEKKGNFTFESKEGWGLTSINDTLLIMSDGTNQLTFLDPKNLKVEKKIEVFENDVAVVNLNELEFVNGFIYANIYTTCRVVKIDVKSGLVVGSIDFNSLCYEALTKFSGAQELNGIAYNKDKDTFFITGKMWPSIYEVKLN